MFMALCITGSTTPSLGIQVVAERFMRRLITFGLTVNLNQGFISPMGALLSLTMLTSRVSMHYSYYLD